MARIFERRLTSTHSFEVFHTSLRSIWQLELELKINLTATYGSSLAFDYNSSNIRITFERRANQGHPCGFLLSYSSLPYVQMLNSKRIYHFQALSHQMNMPSKVLYETILTKPLFRYSLEGYRTKPFVRNLMDIILERFRSKPFVRNLFDFFL